VSGFVLGYASALLRRLTARPQSAAGHGGLPAS
jgi:hypothetical protein